MSRNELGQKYYTELETIPIASRDPRELLYLFISTSSFDFVENSYIYEKESSLKFSFITSYINDLKISKDPGPMMLSANFLQFNIDVMAPLLLDSIHTIFQTGRIPELWKKCFIIPIPKKGY